MEKRSKPKIKRSKLKDLRPLATTLTISPLSQKKCKRTLMFSRLDWVNLNKLEVNWSNRMILYIISSRLRRETSCNNVKTERMRCNNHAKKSLLKCKDNAKKERVKCKESAKIEKTKFRDNAKKEKTLSLENVKIERTNFINSSNLFKTRIKACKMTFRAF